MAMHVISVVGAGGKTTYIHRLADRYLSGGKRVLVMTTTHMLSEADTDTSCDADIICQRLKKDHYCMAGRTSPKDPMKITILPEPVFSQVIGFADIVLIEADGAKCHPAKYPNATEPVIPAQTTEIVLLMGMAACGHRVKETVFRHELIEDGTGICPDDIVTEETLLWLMEYGYLRRFRQEHPSLPVRCFLTDQGEYKEKRIL